MNAYMVKSPDGGLLSWTFSTTRQVAIDSFVHITGAKWRDAKRSGGVVVQVTVIENDSSLDAMGMLYGKK